MINLEALIRQGEVAVGELDRQEQAHKSDCLRGGNGGCIVDGHVVGGCHRKAIARLLGFDIPPNDRSRMFFDAGRGIEEALNTKFQALDSHRILREEECEVRWSLPSGREVSGRPDFMVFDSTDAPQLGVELKTIVSSSKAHSVWFDHKPGCDHMCQAAHYSWQKDTPWVLMYYSPVVYTVEFRQQKKHGLRFGSKLEPYRMYFYMSIRDGKVFYKSPATGEEVPTILTTGGIQQYYQLVDECVTERSLFTTPLNVEVDGSPMPWQHERYCVPCQVATEVSGDWNQWCDEMHARKEGA